MVLLTFTVQNEASSDTDLLLTPCSHSNISEAMWEELAARIAGERALIPYPAATLAQRCHEGYAAAVICCEHIVSYTSLIPIALRSPGPYSWQAITADLDVDQAAHPGTDVYEFTSSWTDPAWRRKRITPTLRLALAERYLQAQAAASRDALGLGGMVGLTSSNLARMGWQILAWDAAPFVSSLIAVAYSDFPAQAAMGWRPPEGPKPYQGLNIPVNDPTHRWEQFCHWWVSSPVITVQLDRELAELMHGDLHRWQTAVVAAFATPGSPHKLAFLDQVDMAHVG